MSSPHTRRAESRVIHQLKGTEGPGSGDPLHGDRGFALVLPRHLGAGGHTSVGERRQMPVPCLSCPALPVLPVSRLCPACPANALPVLPVPSLRHVCALSLPFPSRLHPLTYSAARLRHPLRIRLQILSKATAAADPAGRERLRLAPPGLRRTAGEEKGKGIEGRGRKERRTERQGTARYGKTFLLHQDKRRTHSNLSHPEWDSTGGDLLELSLKVSGRNRRDI